ncbi:MAG: hydroxymethylbilane synthase [Chloroflexi bacterium]|nr:hydroxymethylbilane synthase [Chloroflexota bacterium]
MSPPRSFRVGTRTSPLAMRQTQIVLDLLAQHHPGVRLDVVGIKTRGDVQQSAPLESLGRGVFVKEIEAALLRGEIDLAVHSLKDMPTDPTPGLAIVAYPPRDDPRDALISRHNLPLERLPPGARVGTSSSRRAAQVLAIRPDVVARPLRGNVDTRLRKALTREYDAIVIAAAGVLRLGLGERITQYLAPEVCLPEAGQGALAVQARADDGEATRLLSAIDDVATRQAVVAERAVVSALGGGCRVPIAALAQVKGEMLEAQGLVASADGRRLVRARALGRREAPEAVGRELALKLLEMGAKDVLAEA